MGLVLGGATPSALMLGADVVLAAYLGADLVYSAGEAANQAALDATDGADVASFSVALTIGAAFAGVDGADVASLGGAVVVTATLAATDGADLAAFAGDILTAQLSGTDGADLAAWSGAVEIAASLTGTEAADAAAFASTSVVSVSMAGIEGADTGSLLAAALVSGALAGTDGADAASFAGEVIEPSGIEWEFIGFTTGGTSLSYHASMQAGDLGIYVDAALRSDPESLPSAVTPTDHTVRLNHSGNAGVFGTRLMVSTKILTGSEGAITGMNDGAEGKVGLVFRPSIAINSLATGTWQTSGPTTGNPGSMTIDIDAIIDALVAIGIMWGNDDTPAFSSASPSFDAVQAYDAGAYGLAVGYKMYNAGDTVVDQQADAGDTGTVTHAALGYISAAPA